MGQRWRTSLLGFIGALGSTHLLLLAYSALVLGCVVYVNDPVVIPPLTEQLSKQLTLEEQYDESNREDNGVTDQLDPPFHIVLYRHVGAFVQGPGRTHDHQKKGCDGPA